MVGQGETVEQGDIDSVKYTEFNEEEYVDHFTRLVELEREEEMELHEDEMKRLSGWEREKKGRAILNARAKDEGTGLANKHLVKFVRRDGMPETEISVGDLIRASKNHPLSDDNPSGTVIEKTGYSLTAAFDEKPPGWIFDKVRVDLYVNDITYQRMLDAVNSVPDLKGKKRKLVKKLLSSEGLEHEHDDIDDVYLINRELNDSQIEAVHDALRSDDIHLIHGPPGTGKTITCVEVIEQAIEMDQSIIASADSNTAVDNLVEHLVNKGRRVVRVGHPARVTPLLREHTLDYLLEDNDTFQKADELREQALEFEEEQEKYTYPSGRWRRGLSNKAIKSLAEKGKGSRGVPPDKIKEMAKSLELQEKVDELFKKVDHLEDKAVNEVIQRSDVVCSTNSSSGSEILGNREFDLCVIDEATQATEPSCLIPIVKAEKVVMAGDHKQLPPTIKNQKAKRDGLADTMFERVIAMYGTPVKTLLQIQYRMNETIMQFPDETFYEGKVEAHGSVRNHTLDEILESVPMGKFSDVLDPKEPMVFLDTLGNILERSREGSTSKENPGESVLVSKIVEELLESGVSGLDIGVITPYDDQKDHIDSKIDIQDLEVDTVDGFQGREKEVIILSLTRSNKSNNIGFLRDLRRLNVSITRARRKLIIIGDSTTLSEHPVYDSLFNYIKDEGKYIKVKL
ncbi:MAG: IGHMBP2 family helicase [Candidatus Saliniplasma sp.]